MTKETTAFIIEFVSSFSYFFECNSRSSIHFNIDLT